MTLFSSSQPLKIGIIGTGFTAQRRAETLQKDSRVRLTFVTGHTPANIDTFCQTYDVTALDNWQSLVAHPEIDLVMVCSINCDHGKMTHAALSARKHVVVEYPLALNAQEAENIVQLAQNTQKMLHIEHLELLGELHHTVRHYLPQLGNLFYGRYTTFTPKHPSPQNWTFHKEKFGFPLSAAVSRIHRFTDLFGEVATVNCRSQWWEQSNSDYFRACLTTADLELRQGARINLVYGKGDIFWQNTNVFELYGDRGSIILEGTQGKVTIGETVTPLQLGQRRGLFAKDTEMVIDHLFEGKSLYVTPQASLYALKVADAADKSAKTGKPVTLSNTHA